MFEFLNVHDQDNSIGSGEFNAETVFCAAAYYSRQTWNKLTLDDICRSKLINFYWLFVHSTSDMLSDAVDKTEEVPGRIWWWRAVLRRGRNSCRW